MLCETFIETSLYATWQHKGALHTDDPICLLASSSTEDDEEADDDDDDDDEDEADGDGPTSFFAKGPLGITPTCKYDKYHMSLPCTL